MNPNQLIAEVALDFINTLLEGEPEGSLRYCMLGLDNEIIRSIATAVLDDPRASTTVLVKISPIFDPDGHLPADAKSDESITHWRHCPLPDDKRGVLFAASQEELQRNDKSVEKITKIETDKLRDRYATWIDKAGITGQHLDRNQRKQLLVALASANDTHVARTIGVFADFVLSIADGILSKGLPPQDAVDNALPSLRLPRYAGEFSRIVAAKREKPTEWKKKFRYLDKRVRPLLVRETDQGEPISREILRNKIEDLSDRLTDAERTIINNFIDEDLRPDSWSDAQRALVELDWRKISGLFEDSITKDRARLGEQTIAFFEDEFDDKLDESERATLKDPLPKDPSDDLQEFFESNRDRLAQRPTLSRAWERYIYRNPKTYQDFLFGLLVTIGTLCKRALNNDSAGKKVVVRISNARAKSFWNDKNPRVARYFAFRYRGIEKLLGEQVELDFGRLEDFYFPKTDAELATVTARSRNARSLKFEVVLDPDGANERLIFHWEMPVNAIGASLPDDLLSVANIEEKYALLSTADITRQPISAKGSIQRIDLNDVNTIHDANHANDGRLVAPNNESDDLSSAFLSALEDPDLRISPEGIAKIRSGFDTFQNAYTEAIRRWVGEDGIASDALISQADAYGVFLECLSKYANQDLARRHLWHGILRLGIANVGAGALAAIITPWHPLRLTEIGIKARQASDLIREILSAKSDALSGFDLLVDQKENDFSSVFYPEVCIWSDHGQAQLLTASETSFDYTLAEAPLRGNDSDALDADPGTAAKKFGEVGEQYLKLLPHERNNFSVVLYNAESKALPTALASELSSRVQQEDELQCDLWLTHSDPRRLRRIYEQQNVAVTDNTGSLMASDAAQNFLSRMRVGVMMEADLQGNDTDRPADLVVLQDVVSRNAKLRWMPAPHPRDPDLREHVPTRWSRRRPVARTDTSAAVYLACPVQPPAGQAYLNTLWRFLERDDLPRENLRLVPAREIDFFGGSVGNVFSRTHRIGEWVVNFDELVDRRLLEYNGIKVIRHIHDRHANRHVVVSTTSNPRLLRALLRDQLKPLVPDIIEGNSQVIDALIDRASQLSGQVVMRAARHGHYANELLGLVLSMEEICSEVGIDLPLGWYFLDDFAAWFGEREEQIADIMAIAPRLKDGKPVLRVVISEAKFIASKSYRDHARKSKNQLTATTLRLGEALDHQRIDRDIWLDILGDFMIKGMEPFVSGQVNDWNLHRWSDEVRRGKVLIDLQGFSHVFVYDNENSVDTADDLFLVGTSRCARQVFDKPRVVTAIRSFAAGLISSGSKPVLESQDSARTPSGMTPHTATIDSGTLGSTASDAEANDSADAEKNPGEVIAVEDVEPDTESTSTPVRSDEAESEDSQDTEASEVGSGEWSSPELAAWVAAGRISGEEEGEAKAWLDEQVTSLQRALRGYDLAAEVLGKRLTPNAALVRLRGSDNLTVLKVEKRQQELLTSHGIEVINVLAEPGEVVIMVKRPQRTILRLRDLWRQRSLPSSAPESNTSLLLGTREADGELMYLNVGEEFGGQPLHGPHTLIAGETGSGKGILVQCLLLDICATNAPAYAHIQMIDPKAGIDFSWLKGMPHLQGDIITDQDAAVGALEGLVDEMERRNRLLANAGVNKLSHYNRQAEPGARLPRIWLFHDELADWMMGKEYRDAVELNANRLGVKARAAGINLVLVAQRPDKDALPMQLRANLSNRLVLRVADKKNSIIALDEGGAERLLGRGHLAAKLSGEGGVMFAQVPFVDENEISALARVIAAAWDA